MNAQLADAPTEGDDLDEADLDARVPDEDLVARRRGRGGFDPHADAVASAARYEFRQRSVLGLLIAAIMTAALAIIVSPMMWLVSGAVVVALVGYLVYLRRQVQLEQEIRRRRLARLKRARQGDERGGGQDVPDRLRRPGAIVLEADDEDPAFEHLDHYVAEDGYDVPAYGRYDTYGGSDDYVVPRAVGE